MKNINFMKMIVKASALFIALNGIIVIIARLTHHDYLLQYDILPAMQFNTAICFILAGLGLFFLDHPKTIYLKFMGFAIVIIALTAGSEFITNINFDIEALVLSKFALTKNIIPEKISPFSALDFLLSGFAFLLFAFKNNKYDNNHIVSITLLGSVVALVALNVLLESVTGIISASTWDNITLMSLHSSICFIVLGSVLVLYAFMTTEDLPFLFPIPILIALLTAVVCVSYSIKKFEDTRFSDSIRRELMHASQEFVLYQTTLYHALDRMKERWDTEGGTPRAWFEADATSYIGDFTTLQALSYVNADMLITWVVPFEKYKKFIGYSYKLEPERARTVAKALETHQAQTTKPLRLLSNNMPGFIYMNPLYNKGKFEGLLIATFNAQVSFNYLFQKSLLPFYDLVVMEEQTEIFNSDPGNKKLAKKWTQSNSFVVVNKLWNFSLTPKKKLIAEKNSYVPLTVLIVGILTSLITTLAIYFGLKTRQTQAELQWNKNWLQGIMDASHHSIIATNLDGTILLFNHAAENVLGYTTQEMVGKQTPEIIHNPNEVTVRAQEMSLKLGREVKPGFETFTSKLENKSVDEAEWIYVRKDKTEFPVWLSISPLYVTGKIVGYVGIAQDISERKALDAMKTEFISIVSHELRTPLTSIQGVLGLMLGGALGEFSERAQSMLTIAHNNCERLIRLINDILDIEKIEAGKMEFKLTTVELNQFASESVEINQSYADKFDVQLKLKLWPAKIFATVDSDRLQQVFANLLSNAAKFSPHDAKVWVKISFDQGQAIIKVRDFGAGIPDAFQKNIFGKFSQADSTASRAKGGTGLGLSISKAIVEKMGGSICFETEINKGTTFIVMLPAREEKPYAGSDVSNS
jgi:PAS domain S-box-containing protein